VSIWFALLLLAVVSAAAYRIGAARRESPPPGRLELHLTVADRAESVEGLVRAILSLLAAYGGPGAELVVVDAGSRDDTPAILSRLAGEYAGRLKISSPSAR
jgi:hypothetical protein